MKLNERATSAQRRARAVGAVAVASVLLMTGCGASHDETISRLPFTSTDGPGASAANEPVSALTSWQQRAEQQVAADRRNGVLGASATEAGSGALSGHRDAVTPERSTGAPAQSDIEIAAHDTSVSQANLVAPVSPQAGAAPTTQQALDTLTELRAQSAYLGEPGGLTMTAAQRGVAAAYADALTAVRTAQQTPVQPHSAAVAAVLTPQFARAITELALRPQQRDRLAVRWHHGPEPQARFWQVDISDGTGDAREHLEAHVAGCQRYAATTYRAGDDATVESVDAIEHFSARLEPNAAGNGWLLAAYQSREAHGWSQC